MKLAVAIALLVLVATPASASAHALLDRTEPERGAEVDQAPGKVAFYFDEPVEASFGSVHVFDAEGEQVESGEITRPGDDSKAVAVPLPGDLADGTYTATYRVVSADSHPVSGGFVFTVGSGGPASGQTVSELLDESDSGPVTSVAFWAARWLGYGEIGLGIGAFVFLLAVWRPALRRAPGAGWAEASETFAGRFRTIVLAAAVTGLVASLAAIPLQGATASGISFFSALDPDVIGEVLDTRFGTLSALRALAWLLVIAAALRPRLRVLVPLPLGFLLAAPALAGHATTQGPGWVLVPSNLVHVAAMSVWLGGLAMLVLAVPAATRRLQPPERTRLLAAVLLRFSPLALVSVIALLATGIAQSIVYLGALDDLLDTAFGRAILIKALLLAVLIGLGAFNRRRSVPEMARLADGGEPPGQAGRALRRSLRAEVALIVVVLGVTAALVSYAPPSEAGEGPVSGATDIGPARLEYTVDPAAVGRNELHLYLFDADSGAQYTGAKEVTVDLSLPEKEIGPIEAELHESGPGHYVAPAAPFGVAGEWTVEVSMRVSKFEQDETELEVPIE